MNNATVTYRRLIMPKDLNAANRLFGGTMMAWMDEAAALYVMCQTNSMNIVTAKVSEIEFRKPVGQGEFLSFEASTTRVGRTSLTVGITAMRKAIGTDYPDEAVCSCEMIFVTIDPATGSPTPHGIGLK